MSAPTSPDSFELGCCDPEMGARLASLNGRERAPLAPEYARHLRACPACKASVERSRRMAVAWRQLEPRGAEVAAARARFQLRRSGRARARVSPLVLAFGALFVGATAFGAIGVVSRQLAPVVAAGGGAGAPSAAPRAVARAGSAGTRELRESTAPAAASPTASPVAAASETSPAPTSFPTALPHPPASIAPAPTPPRAGASMELATSVAAPLTRAAVAAPSARPAVAVVPAAGEPAPGASSMPPAVASPNASSPSSEWVVAAAAMRARDYAAAERAFANLATSGDAKTRDEARLALAQVQIADGRASAARAELVELAASGATPFVRKRAGEALTSLDRSAGTR